MNPITGSVRPGTLNIEDLRGRKDPEAVKAVAREMESLFAYEMIKVMRETSHVSEEKSLGMQTYMSMFDMELAKIFAQRGLGLQEMLTKGISAIAEKAGAALEAPSEKKAPAQVVDGTYQGVSSAYGLRNDPVDGTLKFHKGLDIPAPKGTPVHPARKGTVVFSGEQAGYGNVVVIDHGDGFVTKYAHNESNLVQAGDVVETGSVIAQVGSTGKSTGSHVHFEVLYQGEPVDPSALQA